MTDATETTAQNETKPLESLADAAEAAYQSLTPKERDAFHARFPASTLPETLRQAQAMANVGERFARLAIMAATGCDEATAVARLDDATDRMLNATADAAAQLALEIK